MIKRNFEEHVEYLSNINIYNLDFFNQKEFLQKISSILSIDLENLTNYKEGIYSVQEKLCYDSMELRDPDRQRKLTKNIETDIFLYLFLFDEFKHQQYKIKTFRGYIELNGKFCPVLLNKNFKILSGTILFLYSNLFNLISKDYWHITSTYTNPREKMKIDYEKFYDYYDDIRIIKI